MGDIISILRHSKTVTDEIVRDKILSVKTEVPKSESKVRPATATVSSSSASTTTRKTCLCLTNYLVSIEISSFLS